MPHCPNCGSSDVRYNRIPDHVMEKTLHVGHAAHRLGSHLLTGGAVGAAGLMKLINSCRHEWHCNACRRNFT